MNPRVRDRSDHRRLISRRAGAIAIVAAVVGAIAFAPGASANAVDDAIVADYAADGHITPCRFTQLQLLSVRNQITPEIDAYAPDLRAELNREIARSTNGGCSTGSGGSSSGPFGAHRAKIVSLRLAKNRRSVKVRLRCPAQAPSACNVKLSGKLAGKKATKRKSSSVARDSSKTVKVKLTTTARQRLLDKGGKLKISAKTVGSSLGPASRSVKVAAKP